MKGQIEYTPTEESVTVRDKLHFALKALGECHASMDKIQCIQLNENEKDPDSESIMHELACLAEKLHHSASVLGLRLDDLLQRL